MFLDDKNRENIEKYGDNFINKNLIKLLFNNK